MLFLLDLILNSLLHVSIGASMVDVEGNMDELEKGMQNP
jgi:hypothetical protein